MLGGVDVVAQGRDRVVVVEAPQVQFLVADAAAAGVGQLDDDLGDYLGRAGQQVEDPEIVHLERVEQGEELARSVDTVPRGHDAEPGALAEQVGPVRVPADVVGERGQHGG